MDYLELLDDLKLARLAWQEAGISWSDLKAMGDYERALLAISLGL